MPVLKIRDYLQTQGLHLPEDSVHISYLASRAVMDTGHASIDRSILWYANDDAVLSDYLEQTPEHDTLLKQIFMALDSVFSRVGKAQSATVYALMPSESNKRCLLRLAQQGRPVEQIIPVNDEYSRLYLPARTAQTGWLNWVGNVDEWMARNELQGEHHLRSGSQISLPVCTDSGAVLGVIHVEYQDRDVPDDESLAEWVALSLALSQPLSDLLNIGLSENHDD